ncbi:MAG: cytochrome c biogenesis protein CcsA [Luteolibacter sp.]
MSESKSKAGRWIAAALALGALVCLFALLVKDNMPKGEVRKVDDYKPWSPEILKLAETLPVQDGGREKPLATYAGFKMLGLHGARSMKIEGADGKKLTLKPIGWLMDALYRPHLAVKLPTFRVDNSAVLEAISVKPRGKRDRYSYQDLVPGLKKLGELAQSYQAIEKEKRDPVQTQTIDLSQQVHEFEGLIGHFAYARNGILLKSNVPNQADRRMEVSAVMQTALDIRQKLANPATAPNVKNDLQGVLSQFHHFDQLQQLTQFANSGPNIFPPTSAKDETWKSSGMLISSVIDGSSEDPVKAIEDIKASETTVRAANDNEAFSKAFTVQYNDIVARAKTRGEYKHIGLEADYYRKNWFLNALVLFIFGTVGALVMWTVGRGIWGRIFTWFTFTFTAVGLILGLIAIAQRCIIMERPPIGNLYDTVIFIACTVVLLLLIVEGMVPRRLALGMAPMLGCSLILLARLFEVGDAKDNMDPLVAVLASNFWLATHVITISLGYSAGLVAAFLSFIYVLMRGLGLDHGDRETQRSLTRATYGILCLTLFLSLVGTVLGGIWANYSWGRFWGWDPKENGALLIVLWTLAILHARLGGYLQEWSLHFASLFTACVVTFSWWHVNFFNTGLHNYGFTTGKTTIWVFYSVILLVIVFGVICMASEQSRKSPQRSHFPEDY